MTKRLHVANLALDTSAALIREAFQSDGRRLVRVDLVMSRDPGRSRGFAFVEMETDEDARAALHALNGASIGGRVVRVLEAYPAKSRFGGFAGGPVATRAAAGDAPPVIPPGEGHP